MLVRKLHRLTLNFSKLYQKTAADSKIKELFGETTEADKDTKMAIEKEIMKKAKELTQYNQKVRNYHFYQYKRGEDFIENIPINKDATYTIRDQQAEEAEKDRVSIQQLTPILNHDERAKYLRQKITAYHDKQRKYQLQQFEKYLNEYPGTTKGPRPEDDLEAFRAYAFKKIPKILLDEMAHQKALKQEIQSRADVATQDQQPYAPPMVRAPSTLIDFFGKDRLVYESTELSKEQAQTFAATLQNDENIDVVDDYKNDVPAIPTTPFFNYQHFVRHWLSWSYFRNSYVTYNLQKTFKQLQESLAKMTQIMIDQDGEWMDIPSNIPSLYRYYKCLPKQIQDHPGMKDIYLGLEYTSPDYTNEQKEDALNFTCLWLLPFDEVSTKILNDYTARSRLFATPYIHEKIATISPEFTWDLDAFFDQLKKQELRGQTSNQNKDQRYPEPPEVHKMWEEGAPNLPVDYYENDDGFWDSIISEKLKRYDAHKPMLKTRQHFLH